MDINFIHNDSATLTFHKTAHNCSSPSAHQSPVSNMNSCQPTNNVRQASATSRLSHKIPRTREVYLAIDDGSIWSILVNQGRSRRSGWSGHGRTNNRAGNFFIFFYLIFFPTGPIIEPVILIFAICVNTDSP